MTAPEPAHRAALTAEQAAAVNRALAEARDALRRLPDPSRAVAIDTAIAALGRSVDRASAGELTRRLRIALDAIDAYDKPGVGTPPDSTAANEIGAIRALLEQIATVPAPSAATDSMSTPTTQPR